MNKDDLDKIREALEAAHFAINRVQFPSAKSLVYEALALLPTLAATQEVGVDEVYLHDNLLWPAATLIEPQNDDGISSGGMWIEIGKAIELLRPYLRPVITQECMERVVREMCEAYNWKSAYEDKPADPNAMSAALAALEKELGK